MRIKLKYAITAAAGVILLLWLFCLPRELFEGTSYSTVVTDRNGALLGARVADDGQWRFPPCDTLPEKFVKALVEFEDHTFFGHCGVSPAGVGACHDPEHPQWAYCERGQYPDHAGHPPLAAKATNVVAEIGRNVHGYTT